MEKIFYKYECKNCKFETYSFFKMARHIKKEHNKKLTKKDWKFALKWHIISQTIRTLFKIPLIVLLVLLYLVLLDGSSLSSEI